MSVADHHREISRDDHTETMETDMTATRLAVAGALVLNIPTIFAATVLSAGAIVISAIVLAAIGAALGAVTGWAIAAPAEPAVVAAAVHERLAA
jgi:membrane protein YqaA with SNARE-associated domain